MDKRSKAIYYAQRQVINHSIYVWSGQGQKLLKTLAIKIAEMETSTATGIERSIQAHYSHRFGSSVPDRSSGRQVELVESQCNFPVR